MAKFHGNAVSITSAQGWYAVFEENLCEPLVCWALTNQEKIEGMICAGDNPDFAAKYEGFLNYTNAKPKDSKSYFASL